VELATLAEIEAAERELEYLRQETAQCWVLCAVNRALEHLRKAKEGKA